MLATAKGISQLFRLVRLGLGLLLIGMVFLNVANAAGRYLFGKAIPGSDEVLVFAMAWVVFLGAVLVAARNAHLGFDILPRMLPQKVGRVLHSLRCLAIAGLTGFVALQSWAVLQKLARIDQRSMATDMPMTWPHASLFLGLTMIALVFLVLAIRPLDAWQGSASKTPPGGSAP